MTVTTETEVVAENGTEPGSVDLNPKPTPETPAPQAKRRGRPPGSKNRNTTTAKETPARPRAASSKAVAVLIDNDGVTLLNQDGTSTSIEAAISNAPVFDKRK